MSEISETLWHTEFPDIAKPAKCSYWQFIAGVEKRDQQQLKATVKENIKYYKQLKKDRPNLAEQINEIIKQEMEKLL